MIRKVSLIAIFALMAGVLFAQEQKSVKLTGSLIDNACASGHVNDKDFPNWVKIHSTSCAKMESCEKSGYAVYADNKLYKLDDAGNASAEDVLKNTKSTKGVMVAVEGTVDGDTIKVTKLTEVPAASK
jgi:hypothetical protein